MQSLDAAAQLEYANDSEKLIIMFAVLCHDIGKPATTEKIGGAWKSLGHSQEGVDTSKRMLKRITRKGDLIEAVGKLVRHHMAPAQLINSKAKPSAYKRLARKIAPHATISMLAKVALADKRGRNPIKGKPLKKNFPVIDKFLLNAQHANVQHEPEPAVLLGRDLLDVIAPGPELGELLKAAYEIQIQEGITDKKELRKRVLALRDKELLK